MSLKYFTTTFILFYCSVIAATSAHLQENKINAAITAKIYFIAQLFYFISLVRCADGLTKSLSKTFELKQQFN